MRTLWIGLSALLLAGGAAMWMTARGEPANWTTDSPEALLEFERGLEAQMKFYEPEATRHFKRAIEIDPDFAAPRLYLLDRVGHEVRQAFVEDLRNVDLEPLRERERFLIRYALAQNDQETAHADSILSEYLADYPDDPYALSTCSEAAWMEQDWERAHKHYKTLIKKHPNWVAARNRLGYLAMAQGRFEDAEELFVSYQYIAPDQANPHDSMGELLTVTGRYEEARRELEKALAIKPDFCVSYEHLLDVAVLSGEPWTSDEILDRAAEHCALDWVAAKRCEMQLWQDFFAEDYEAPWREDRTACGDWFDYDLFLVHRMAALTGRTDVALSSEERVREAVSAKSAFPFEERFLRAVSLHMRGFRRIAAGEFEEAVPLLRKADDLFSYWGNSQGILKLYNRLHLAYAYERKGADDKATDLIAEVREVNSSFAEVYEGLRDSLDRS